MEDRTIADSQISASSVYNVGFQWFAYNGRLNSPDHFFWHANLFSVDPNPWIQVDFLTPVYISGIITQGGCVFSPCVVPGWVYYVQIQTGDTLSGLTYIMEGGSPKVRIETKNKPLKKVWKLFSLTNFIFF